MLYALTLILRALVVAIDRRGSLRTLVDRLLHGALSYRIAPLLLAAPLAALLYVTPWWQQWSGLPTPLFGFVPSFPSVAIFGTSVLFGWCLHRQQSLLELLRRDYALYLAVAVLASFAALYLVGVRMNMTVMSDVVRKYAPHTPAHTCSRCGAGRWDWSAPRWRGCRRRARAGVTCRMRRTGCTSSMCPSSGDCRPG